LLRSSVSYKQGKVEWKGRTYAGATANNPVRRVQAI